jgi:hypothetical protein
MVTLSIAHKCHRRICGMFYWCDFIRIYCNIVYFALRFNERIIQLVLTIPSLFWNEFFILEFSYILGCIRYSVQSIPPPTKSCMITIFRGIPLGILAEVCWSSSIILRCDVFNHPVMERVSKNLISAELLETEIYIYIYTCTFFDKAALVYLTMFSQLYNLWIIVNGKLGKMCQEPILVHFRMTEDIEKTSKYFSHCA